MNQSNEYFVFSEEAGNGHIRLNHTMEQVTLLMREAESPRILPIILTYQQIAEMYGLIHSQILASPDTENGVIPMA